MDIAAIQRKDEERMFHARSTLGDKTSKNYRRFITKYKTWVAKEGRRVDMTLVNAEDFATWFYTDFLERRKHIMSYPDWYVVRVRTRPPCERQKQALPNSRSHIPLH